MTPRNKAASGPRVADKRLRRFALGFPEAREDHPWGHSAFKVSGRAFLFMASEKTGLSLSMKLPQSGLLALSLPFAQPTGYGLGKSGWVTASFEAGKTPPQGVLERWIEESYRTIAPKRLAAILDAPAGTRKPAPQRNAAKPGPKKALIATAPLHPPGDAGRSVRRTGSRPAPRPRAARRSAPRTRTARPGTRRSPSRPGR